MPINSLFSKFSTVCRSAVLGLALSFALSATADTRFTLINNDQEVLDNQTGLIWRRCYEGTVLSNNNKSCNFASPAAASYDLIEVTHEAAFQLATREAQTTGLPWRLPNVRELFSIVDTKVKLPGIDSTLFPNTPTSRGFWTSTPASFEGGAWAVVFDFGGTTTKQRSSKQYVRLVRQGD